MRLVCAWCGKKLKGTRTGCREGISYGICLPCANGILTGTPSLMKEYVEHLDSPVAVVNGAGIVVTANSLACALLQKELAQLEGAGCGELFGCAETERGTCGTIEECAGCEIKRCVSRTHRTGKGISRVPAHLREGTPRAREDVWWLISTSRFLDCVVLTIAGTSRVRKEKLGKEPEGQKALPRHKGRVTAAGSGQSGELPPPPRAPSRRTSAPA